jgi:hypothetical protein
VALKHQRKSNQSCHDIAESGVKAQKKSNQSCHDITEKLLI